jgi:integrase
MATYTKRSYQSWRVSVATQTTLTKAFDAPTEARAYAQQLIDLGHKEVQTKAHQSTGWQVRIRSQLAPQLTKTFPTKAAAQVWAQAREGEIVKRQFVDYREADRVTLGDLLRRYDEECLAARPPHDPDRSRIRKLCRHPITLIRMSAIQPADFAEFRGQRLRGGFVEPKSAGAIAVVWPAIKGSSVKRELDLMSSVISHARREWKVHIASNPAAAQNTSRPDKAPGDERNRRLAAVYQAGESGDLSAVPGSACRAPRTTTASASSELDPETTQLLRMPQSEQQALLRASRYPHWFRPRKKSVTDKTVQARATKKGQSVCKARLRPTGGLWAIISFAIETAMRRGEMVQLRWSHVHLEHGNGFLELPWTITKNKKARIVPLSLRARRILQTRARTSEFVFATNQNTIKLGFKRALARVQVQDLRLHDLRHEATSRIFEKTTLRTSEVGHITGHTDPRMLQRYYNMRPEEFVDRFAKSFK